MAALEIITSKIIVIRGVRVIIDSDLAELYGVETRQLNQACNRNPERFPEDFRFQLSRDEVKNLRSQIVTLPEKVGRTYLKSRVSKILHWVPAFAGMTKFFKLKVAL